MKVSVCMAAYQGAKYIKPQVASILSQLESSDELVIVDDASQDETIEIINKFNDPRIKLIYNQTNLGAIKTFEKALKFVNNDIIFLSDQDDIWLPNKVSIIKEKFQKHPTITLVLSDAYIIDSHNKIVSDSYFKIRGKFVSGVIPNIIKNKYLGCTMAFRKKMIKYFLPFPSDIPMHDIWMGIVNATYGKTYYINEPLIQYRLHGNNASRGPINHADIKQMIVWRYLLIKNLIKQRLIKSLHLL